MEQGPFWELLDETLVSSQNPLDLYGPGRKQLVQRWGSFLDMHRSPDTGAVDWGDVRATLSRLNSGNALADRKFGDALRSILIELCGVNEGLVGARTVLARWPGYKT